MNEILSAHGKTGVFAEHTPHSSLSPGPLIKVADKARVAKFLGVEVGVGKRHKVVASGLGKRIFVGEAPFYHLHKYLK